MTRPAKNKPWNQGVGRIDFTCLKTQFGSISVGNAMVLVCGPTGVCEVVKQWCKSEGWDLEKDLVVF